MQLNPRNSVDEIILRGKGAELRDINDSEGVLADGSSQWAVVSSQWAVGSGQWKWELKGL